MQLYMVIGIDDRPHSVARRDALRAQHVAYVRGDEGAIRMVGPLREEDDDTISGSVYIFEAESAAWIWAWLDKEPYYKGGVYREMIVRPYEIRKNELLPKARGPEPAVPSAARRS
jgi:uncharacterized protein YciI